MGQRTYIRISYRTGLEAVEAEHLGQDADGSELYRTWREGRVSGEPMRVDVLRLCRQEGEGFDFVGSADPSRRDTSHLTIARACYGMPSCSAFYRQLEEHGCVVENESSDGNATYVVVSHSTGLPLHEWHAHMLQQTIGVAPEDLREYLNAEAWDRNEEAKRRRARQRLTRGISRTAAFVGTVAIVLVVVGIVVVVGRGGMTAFFGAAAADRPRVAAMGMIVALAPLLLSRSGRSMWPMWAGGAALGIAAVTMLGGPTPAYGAAAALGAVYALFVGALAVILAIFSLFSSNAGEMGKVVFGVVLPALLSALAAAAVAVTSAAAAGHSGGMGKGARTIAIVITALLLLPVALVLLSNAGAILGGKAWRRNPRLQVRALATLPLTMAPALRKVSIPIVLIWAAVWLLGRLG